MDSKTITKYVNLLLDIEPEDLVSYSNLQFHYLKSNEDIIEYFSLLSNANIFYASLIYFYFKKHYRYGNEKVGEIIKTKLSEQCEKLQGDKIDLKPTSNANSKQISEKLSEIRSISELCIATLIICDNEVLREDIFLKNVKRIRSREDSYGLFLSRCSELLALLDNQNRCFFTVTLINLMKHYRNDDENRVLYLILKILANWPLYFYGDVSPVMIHFINELYSLNNPHILLQLLDLFPQIDFSLLSTDIVTILKVSESFRGTKRVESDLIKLIQCADTLNSRAINGLSKKDFRDAVYNVYHHFFDDDPALLQTVNLYFVCRNIKDDPLNIDCYINDIIETNRIYYYTLMSIEQAAFSSLVRDNPTKASVFLRKLGNANVSRINYPIRNTGINYNIHRPELDKYTDLYRSQLEKLSTLCDIDELVYIYFNSFIRSSLPIEELFRKLYDKSPKKRDDYMKVANTFSHYVIDGKIVFGKRSVPHFTTEQFCSVSPYLTVSGYDRLTSDDIKRLKSENSGLVRLTIDSYSVVAGFNPHLKIVASDSIKSLSINKKETINSYVDFLSTIAEKGDYSCKDISILKDLPAGLVRNSDYARLGMCLIRCCDSFNDISKSIKFLKAIPNNPYKYGFHHNIAIQVGIRLEDDDYQFCLEFVKHIIEGKGFLEDKLYIYFNTILRSVYFLNSFLSRLSGDDNYLDLRMLFDSYGLRLHGQIKNINQNEIRIIPHGISLRHEWSIISYKQNKAFDHKESYDVQFGLLEAYIKEKRIIVEDIKKRTFRNAYFCAGMNKAKLTLDLDNYDTRNLLKKPSGLKNDELIRLAMDELLALKLRMNDVELLSQFISLIQKSNPWSYMENAIPCIVVKNNSNRYQIESTVNDLIDANPIDFANYVYFNSSLKSMISVDEFTSLLLAKHKDNSLVFSSLSRYTINIFKANTKNGFASNMYLNIKHFSISGEGTYIIDGYDKDANMLKLKPIT